MAEVPDQWRGISACGRLDRYSAECPPCGTT